MTPHQVHLDVYLRHLLARTSEIPDATCQRLVVAIDEALRGPILELARSVLLSATYDGPVECRESWMADRSEALARIDEMLP